MYRRQIEQIKKDIEKKMVFIVGPRQVGKTWLAKEIGKEYETTYLNYDDIVDRKIMKEREWSIDTELLILDELHKMPKWKNFLKGLYDTKNEKLKILVIGSARLDVFRQSGDSLAGRFFVHHLLPFSPSELADTEYEKDIERFINRGGFPEPFLTEEENDAKRWRNQYIDGLIREDILDFEKIHDFKAIKLVFELLRRQIGSTISYTSIARDVGISPTTVKKYIQIFEALYIVFRITPYSNNIARSLLKEPKIFFFDTGLVIGDSGSRFENLIALGLLKDVLAQNDYLGKRKQLKYLRTKDGKEVDFAIIDDGKIEKIIEAKNANKNIDKNLKYFANTYSLNAVQVVNKLEKEKTQNGIQLVRADNFLKKLYL